MAITYGNVGFNKVDLRPVGININIFLMIIFYFII